MPKLTDDIKLFVVTQLAQFRGYAEVARLVVDETGVVVDRFQVRTYDPRNLAYAGGDKWRAIFDAERQAYLNSLESIPIAKQAYRLNELQRNYTDARNRGNLVLANATLEQAAKEMGKALTNERDLMIDRRRSLLADLTSEERRAMAAEVVRDVLCKMHEAGPAHSR